MTGLDTAQLEAVLLDVDGTLVDTTYLHAVCWSDAFAEAGLARPTADLHALIGMSSDRLIDAMLGDSPAAPQLRDDLDRRHLELYSRHWPSLRALPGARELLKRLKELGLLTVLSSSASDAELGALRNALDADDWIDDAASSGDTDRGKPAPDLLRAALDRVRVRPERALMVGDAVWDGEAARAAGVRFVGLTCGGTSEAALFEAGAVAVLTDPAFLLAHL